MFRIDIIDGVATMVPRDAPAPEPALVALPEDTIVLRPNKPLKVVFAEERDGMEEMELEVREIDEPKPEQEPVPEDAREVILPPEFVYEPFVEYEGQNVYRHDTHKDYGCCFETGEIYRFNHKKNTIAGKLAVNIKNGITLSLGFDEDGNRRQKHYGTHIFVGEVALHHGKIKQTSALHTKVAINVACEAYKKRPFIKLYPLGCLALTTDGNIDPNKKQPYDPMGYKGAGMSDGAQLRDRVKTADQIDAFMAQVRRENEKLKNKLEARDAEVAKLKEQLQEKNDENNKLKDEKERYEEHSKSPLKAGAVQLQELLMTEHQGSTVLEMLQFCFKDITRNYPRANDEDYERSDCDADFGIFEMSPRGLSNRNEIITR